MTDHTDGESTAGDAPARMRWRPWLGKALFESALIVLSVLLALSLDSWRETRARARSLAEARASIVEELRFNRTMLAGDAYLLHHERLLAIYRGMVEADTTDQVNAVFKTGVHLAPLRDAAWRSFLASDVASDLPFAQRTLLAGIYGGQEELVHTHRAALGAILAPRADRGQPAFMRDQVRSMSIYLTDVTYAEKSLLQLYDQAVAELTR